MNKDIIRKLIYLVSDLSKIHLNWLGLVKYFHNIFKNKNKMKPELINFMKPDYILGLLFSLKKIKKITKKINLD